MALLSIIRRGREQAKEQKAKDAAKAKEVPPKAPYKHVPKHAAIDAMSSAPSSCKEFDRAMIIEQHRRRSALAASTAPSMKTAPRLGSSLSVVSYPSPRATPVISRNGSFHSAPAYPHPYVKPGATAAHSRGLKGKERELATPLPYGFPSPMLSPGRGYLHGDMGETSSVSDDGLEMKRHARHNVNINPYSVDARPHALRQGATNSENHYLHPTHRRKDSRRGRGGERSDPNSAQVPRTRFTEPQPMDLSVLSMGLDRDSSSTTLGSAQKGRSYASSSTSEAVPISTAPSSLAPTPEPSTMAAYFPSDAEKNLVVSAKESTIEVPPTPSLSETSVDSAVDLSEELDKELDTLEHAALQNKNLGANTRATLPESEKGKQNQPRPQALPAPTSQSKSKSRRWSWRRSKLGAGRKPVASH